MELAQLAGFDEAAEKGLKKKEKKLEANVHRAEKIRNWVHFETFVIML